MEEKSQSAPRWRTSLPPLTSFFSWPLWALVSVLLVLIGLQVLMSSRSTQQQQGAVVRIADFAFYEGVKEEQLEPKTTPMEASRYRYRVRVASFRKRVAAQNYVKELADLHPFIIEEHQTRYGKRYRVYSKWFESKRKMNLFRSQMVHAGLDTLAQRQRIE